MRNPDTRLFSESCICIPPKELTRYVPFGRALPLGDFVLILQVAGADFVIPAQLSERILIGLHYRVCNVVRVLSSGLHHNAQSMAMKEFAYGKLSFQPFQQFPDSEVVVPVERIVHYDDPAGFHLGPPRIEVMFHGLVGVHAVDMQQIDLAVFKACSGLVKRHAEEFREGWIVLLCVRIYFAENIVAVGTSMRIASPGVDGKGSALHSGFGYGLAKREEGLARMSSQLHK
jgi:hypothetical protein